MQFDCITARPCFELYEQSAGLKAVGRSKVIFQSHQPLIERRLGERDDAHQALGVVMGVDKAQAPFVEIAQCDEPLPQYGWR
jgi:hypothetical protein